MSDLPPSTSTSEHVTESVDELINVSALNKVGKFKEVWIFGDRIYYGFAFWMMKQMMRREIEVMLKQMIIPQLDLMVIRILRSSMPSIMEDCVRPILREKLDEAVQKYLARDQGVNEVQNSPRRRFTLRFRKEPSTTIYTGQEIKANDGSPVEVELVDLDSWQVVESGPEAEAKVEIVLLEGDDGYTDNRTPEVVDSKIVGERKGTKLRGNLIIKLEKGIGVIENVKFLSSKTHMPQGFFKLVTRMLGAPEGFYVGEGESISFMVKDYRNLRTEINKKSEIPQLSDEVWRLRKVFKNKKIHNNLKAKNIHSVKDFLLKHFMDAQWLKSIAGMKSNKDWDDTVSHARTCKLDQNISYYMDPQKRTGVVFNLVKQVLGLVEGSEYISVDKVSDYEKEQAHKLAVYALENEKDVLPFDDEASLISYLSSSCGSLNLVVQQGSGNSQIHNNEAYNPQVDPSFSDATSIINFDGDSPIYSVGTSLNFYIDDQPSGSQSSFSLFDKETFFQGCDDYWRERFPNCRFHGHGHDANTEQGNSNSRSNVGKPRVSNWVVLVNRMRGSMVKKRVGMEKLPVQKRQKTDHPISTEALSPSANSFSGLCS